MRKIIVALCVLWLALGVGVNSYGQLPKAANPANDLSQINAKIEEEMACEAVRRGLTERDDVQGQLKNARRQILIQALQNDFMQNIAAPSEPELNAAYQRLKNNFVVPEAYQLDAVVMGGLDETQKKQANALVTGQAVNDKQFQPVSAKAIVTQKSGNWNIQKNIAPEIWKQLALMKLNEVRIIKTKVGDYLIRKGAFRGRQQLPLDQVRKQLEQIVKQEKMNSEWNNFLLKIQQKVISK